jgi:predicted phosphodiesterase
LARQRIAVLSDIHGHAGAYAAALNAARVEGFDTLLILGDLLTYGVEPEKVIALTVEAVERDDAQLILGNHDQIYLDLDHGGSPYVDALPDWIRESVDWTRAVMGTIDLSTAFDWRPNWVSGKLYAAHANPYAYGDWTYLATEASMQAAADSLKAQGYAYGLFGHTHRYRVFDSAENGPQIITVGSLGQPRDRHDPDSQWAMVEIDGQNLAVQRRRVDVRWDDHVAAIQAAALSDATKTKLCGFFTP